MTKGRYKRKARRASPRRGKRRRVEDERPACKRAQRATMRWVDTSAETRRRSRHGRREGEA